MQHTLSTSSGRSARDVSLVARESRRLVGFERHYSCASCGYEHRSWARISACAHCGERLAVARIRRAVVAPVT